MRGGVISLSIDQDAYTLNKKVLYIPDGKQLYEVVCKHQLISTDGRKSYYSNRVNFAEYSEGDSVWFHNPVRKQGLSLKFQRPLKRPCIITEKLSTYCTKNNNHHGERKDYTP